MRTEQDARIGMPSKVGYEPGIWNSAHVSAFSVADGKPSALTLRLITSHRPLRVRRCYGGVRASMTWFKIKSRAPLYAKALSNHTHEFELPRKLIQHGHG